MEDLKIFEVFENFERGLFKGESLKLDFQKDFCLGINFSKYSIQLFKPGNTETNIYYCDNTKLFFSTTYKPQDNRILLTWSSKLTGPWSNPVVIYDVPEKNKSFPVHSYAARIHGWLSQTKGVLIISYATNEFGGIDNLMRSEGMDIYRPRFIEVQLNKYYV